MTYRISSCIAVASLLFGAVLMAPVQAQTYDPPAAKEGFSYPEVYCTNRGERVDLGELSCLHVNGRTFVARCAMSLNNPIWRKVEDGCPAKLEAASGSVPATATATSKQPSGK